MSLAAVLLGMAAPLASASGADLAPKPDSTTPLKFVQGLRERGYYDLALEYLDRLRTAPDTPPDLRVILDYEEGRSLVDEPDPPWARMEFVESQWSFLQAARHGIDARLRWPGLGDVTARELVLHTLLPIAHEGLRAAGVDADVREKFLGVIEGRAETGRNGASWQVATVRTLETGGATRPAALAEMLRRYCDHMHTNEPVHTWDRA